MNKSKRTLETTGNLDIETFNAFQSYIQSYVQSYILPSSCYTFPCKIVTRIWCWIKITTLSILITCFVG